MRRRRRVLHLPVRGGLHRRSLLLPRPRLPRGGPEPVPERRGVRGQGDGLALRVRLQGRVQGEELPGQRGRLREQPVPGGEFN